MTRKAATAAAPPAESAALAPGLDAARRAHEGGVAKPQRSDILKGVVAHVHVNTDDDADASTGFAADLHALGAKVRKTLCADCTHLVVQNPSRAIRSKYATLFARNLKEPAADATLSTKRPEKSRPPPAPVSVLWVNECKKRGKAVEAAGFLVDMSLPATNSRSKKRKSMEPTTVTEVSATEDRFSSTQQLLASNHAASPATHRSLQSPPAIESKEPLLRRSLIAPPTLNLPSGPAAPVDIAGKVEVIPDEAFPNIQPPNSSARSPQIIGETPIKPAVGKHCEGKSTLQSRGSSGSAVLKEVDGNKSDQTAAKRRRSDSSLKSGENGPSRKKSLVMTNVNDAMRDIVVSTVRKLGGFKVGNSVQKSTTHVVSGSATRTMSIMKAIALGCWIVSPEWVYRSLESGTWQGEATFELNVAFPACHKSRVLSAKIAETEDGSAGNVQGLFAGLKIFVGRTKAPRQEVQELVVLLGGRSVESFSQADVILGSGVIQSRKPAKEVIQEKWMYDCVSRYTLLPRGPYMLSPSKAAASAGDPSEDGEEVDNSDTTVENGSEGIGGDDDETSDGDDDSGGNGVRSATSKKKNGGRGEQQEKGAPTPSTVAKAKKSGPANTLSPQF